MNRRTFLTGTTTAALAGAAGCLGGASDGNENGGNGGNGGSGNAATNEFDYETTSTDGVEVPLAPVTDVYEWYENEEAEIIDARQRTQYDETRVAGAAFSPAPDGADDDPTADWDEDTRIVTYCRCPHHLASMRAAALIDAGYENVYAIDEGLGGWEENQYPLEGSDVNAELSSYEIHGTTGTDHAGEMVLMDQVGVDRREAAPIGDDGSYTLELHYGGSTDDRFRVEAPDYTTEGTLADLTSGPLSA